MIIASVVQENGEEMNPTWWATHFALEDIAEAWYARRLTDQLLDRIKEKFKEKEWFFTDFDNHRYYPQFIRFFSYNNLLGNSYVSYVDDPSLLDELIDMLCAKEAESESINELVAGLAEDSFDLEKMEIWPRKTLFAYK